MMHDTSRPDRDERDSEARLRFLDELTRATLPLGDPTAVMTVTARLLGQHLGAAVCAYADMAPDQDAFTIRGNWTAPGAASITGRYRLAEFGTTAVERLRAGQPLVTRDTLNELGPAEASRFLELGLKATVCMPLVKDGRLIALMAVHAAEARDWSDKELALIAETTDRSWAHIERVRSEKALRESEERFRAAVDAVQGIVWTNDASGRMVGEQPGWERLTGQSRSDYEGFGWAEAVHPDDRAATVEAWQRAVADTRPFVFEHRVRARDGLFRTFSIRANPLVGADGAVRGWVGVHTDITEAREAEAALRAESRILETLNRTGAELAAELDLHALVQKVVDAGVELTGARHGAFFYNVFDAAGERYMLFALSGASRSQFESFGMPRATAIFRPTFEGEGVVRSDDILADPRYGQSEPHRGMPPGHLPVRSYLAVPVASRSGEVIGGLFFGHPEPRRFGERHERMLVGLAGQAAVAIDNARLYQALQRSNETLEQRVAEEIAERARTEDALRQAQKMEAIGQLTGGVAHDFNNLLTVIRSSADLLRRRELSEERRRRYVDAISDTADRAAKLTGQLLTFSRRQALRPEVFDVGERVVAVAEMLRTVLGARIELAVANDCPSCRIEADPGQFETALVNMAVNARDAMDGEGRLSIAVRPGLKPPPLRRDSGGGSPFVTVEITDSGTGIAPENLPRIFEPFFTTKEVGKGTGLGLSQVYGFAKQSGGDIEVESVLGVGTTFTLHLPRTEATRTAATATAGQPVPAMHGRILVVEDNPEVGEFASQLLQDLGYDTILAATASEALAVLARHDGFDLVFSDVVMPGMSGVELGRRVREQWPGLPVVLTSGYSHVLAADAGHGFPLLHKPYSVEELSRVLQTTRRGARPRP